MRNKQQTIKTYRVWHTVLWEKYSRKGLRWGAIFNRRPGKISMKRWHWSNYPLKGRGWAMGLSRRKMVLSRQNRVCTWEVHGPVVWPGQGGVNQQEDTEKEVKGAQAGAGRTLRATVTIKCSAFTLSETGSHREVLSRGATWNDIL